ncbi:MAG: hypothetical protein H0U16_03155 [Actinobacteria bacterium]|nr:hypothetical protein [Actinomycetota bacterium]
MGDDRARVVLREYSNLALAVQVVEQGRLNERLRELTNSIEVLTGEVPRMDPPGLEEATSAEELLARVKALLAVVRSQIEDDD